MHGVASQQISRPNQPTQSGAVSSAQVSVHRDKGDENEYINCSYLTYAGSNIDHEALVTLSGQLAQFNPCNIGNSLTQLAFS